MCFLIFVCKITKKFNWPWCLMQGTSHAYFKFLFFVFVLYAKCCGRLEMLMTYLLLQVGTYVVWILYMQVCVGC